MMLFNEVTQCFCFLFLLAVLGVSLCVNYRHSIADFLPMLEAFMLNCDDASLSIDKIGQFEQSLYAETRSRQSVLEKKSQSDSRSQKKKVELISNVSCYLMER
jgi:hypothetical protein